MGADPPIDCGFANGFDRLGCMTEILLLDFPFSYFCPVYMASGLLHEHFPPSFYRRL